MKNGTVVNPQFTQGKSETGKSEKDNNNSTRKVKKILVTNMVCLAKDRTTKVYATVFLLGLKCVLYPKETIVWDLKPSDVAIGVRWVSEFGKEIHRDKFKITR